MEIPDRLAQAVDGETIQSAVNLGDEDLVCFTPTRTLLYSSEGLLSDESVEVFDHDIERLDISEGRRKTKFSLEYVDAVEEFSVSRKRGEQVLKRLIAGILDTAGVLEDEESVVGVFLFSELTLIITDSRLVKHVGSSVWDSDFEVYPFSEVTRLDFEEGKLATQIVISIAGRPQRIKAPSDEAKKLEQTLTAALFAYHDVQSLEELNEAVATEAESTADAPSDEASSGFEFGDDITPLVTDDEAEDSNESGGRDELIGTDAENTDARTSLSAGDGPTMVADSDEVDSETSSENEPAADAAGSPKRTSDSIDRVTSADIEEMNAQLETLTAAVESNRQEIVAQRELIETQQQTIEKLIEELRRQL